jgi:hypothetical protein
MSSFGLVFKDRTMRLSSLSIIVLLGICQQTSAQIVPQPLYSFERLSWRDSIGSVRQTLGVNHPVALKDTNDRHGVWAYSYTDTVGNIPVQVGLNFADRGQHLIAIMLYVFGDTEGPSTPDSVKARNVETVWNQFTLHYGSAHTDQTIMSMGSARTWRYWQATVQMTRIHGPAEILTVLYRQ